MFRGSGISESTVGQEISGSAVWRKCKDNRGLLQLVLLTEPRGNLDCVQLWFMTGYIGVGQAFAWQTRFTAGPGRFGSSRWVTRLLWYRAYEPKMSDEVSTPTNVHQVQCSHEQKTRWFILTVPCSHPIDTRHLHRPTHLTTSESNNTILSHNFGSLRLLHVGRAPGLLKSLRRISKYEK
jgi:hypothetical protein